jgi:hypothetical protein
MNKNKNQMFKSETIKTLTLGPQNAVQPSLMDDDMKQYLAEVLEEIKKLKYQS